jgi:prepilin-type N-terminal cleavage/methylation domain-containing protein
MKKNSKMRKGFTFLELVAVILVIGVLVLATSVYVMDGKEKTTTSKYLSDMVRITHESLMQYKDESYLTSNDFASLTPTNAEPFFDSKFFTLSGGVFIPKDFPDATIDFLPAPSSGGNNNRTYKILFDFSNVKSEKGWSNQEAMNFENKIANFFKTASATTVIGGAATSLGAANVDVAASAPNADAIIVIQFDR